MMTAKVLQVKITLREVKPNDIDAESLEFSPLECMSCEYDDEIPIRYFLVEPPVKTEAEHDELKRLVKAQLDHHDFCSTSWGFSAYPGQIGHEI